MELQRLLGEPEYSVGVRAEHASLRLGVGNADPIPKVPLILFDFLREGPSGDGEAALWIYTHGRAVGDIVADDDRIEVVIALSQRTRDRRGT